MALLLPENEGYAGEVVVLDIGLSKEYPAVPPFILLQQDFVKALLPVRSRFSHKGSFGHMLLLGGSYGKIGALVLAAKAALRSGAGLVTVYVPRCGYTILQTAVPEAMTLTDPSEERITKMDLTSGNFTALGIGPGMGTAPETIEALSAFLPQVHQPMVIDADGLNCLAKTPDLLSLVPKQSILTPHPKEFERLFGICANDWERVQRAQQKARELGLIIVLKGHHSFIAAPDGPGYFNSTGNSGMATGGSGDVLTGIIAALLAQRIPSLHAALIGVYLHGLAGDLGASALSEEALIAGDIPNYLGAAFKKLRQNKP
jgi:ADP-dependent NAD(P)H-hydrate dehydratase / NAD(P)H-hydrate epimerase